MIIMMITLFPIHNIVIIRTKIVPIILIISVMLFIMMLMAIVTIISILIAIIFMIIEIMNSKTKKNKSNRIYNDDDNHNDYIDPILTPILIDCDNAENNNNNDYER